ncbi:MAG TPA: phosphatase PAP2 family protein [Arenicellales bacterium]|nr:phosphatase PAP2 family protein [Arenicellales bacterium]
MKLLAGTVAVLVLVALHQVLRRAACRAQALLGRLRAGFPAAAMWERTHPLRAWLARRWPRGYRFAARRLDIRSAAGLPLTLGLVAAVYIAALAGGLVEELLEADELELVDRTLNHWLDVVRAEPFIAIFTWITSLGSSATLIAVTLVATAFSWVHQGRHCVLPLWITVVGAQATTYLGKFALDRARPEFVTGVTAVTPSFPSGHATGAMAVYGFVAFLIVRELPRRRDRFDVVYWTLVLIAAVGFSRMYLGVHYASDVAAGFLVGCFWLLVGIMLTGLREHRDQRGP